MRALRILAASILALIASSVFAPHGAVAAPAPAPRAAPQPTLVGNWYGIGQPSDPDVFYIDSYHADGTFNSEYRKCVKGKLDYQQTQSGKWTYRGGVLTMNANMIDGKPGTFDHSYTIESLTFTEFQARLHDPTNYLYVQNRIPKFEFPPCYLGV